MKKREAENKENKQFLSKKNWLIFVALLLIGLIFGGIFGYFLGVKVGENNIRKYFDITGNMLTANEAYKISSEKAKKWNSDAELALINLNAPSIQSNGKASDWEIVFFSKKSNNGYKILVKNGEVTDYQGIPFIAKATLRGAWLDSNSVMEKVSGTEAASSIYGMSLNYLEKEHKWIWSINYEKGNITVNAEI